MPVRIPSAQLATLDVNMEGDHNVICVLSSDDLLQSFSMEHTNQIRKIMIQHEELFKEQVQALHRLYNVQKSAMEEVERIICHRDGIPNREVRISVLERKPSTEDNFHPFSYMEGNCSLVDRYAITGATKSLFGGIKEHEYLPETQKRRIRKIDLEKPPEEYMDDFECHLEAKDCEGVADKQHAFQQDTLQKLLYNNMLSARTGTADEESKSTLNSVKMFPLPHQQLQDPVDIRVCSSELQLEDKSGSSHNSSSMHKRAESPDNCSFPKIHVSNSTADSRNHGMIMKSTHEISVEMDQAQFGLEGEFQLHTRDSGCSSTFHADTGDVMENTKVFSNEERRTPTDSIVNIVNSESETIEEGLITMLNAEEPAEEECDTIAANILLSFMPCISENLKWQCVSQSSRDGTSRSEKSIHNGKRSHNSVGKDHIVRLRRSMQGRRRNVRI